MKIKLIICAYMASLPCLALSADSNTIRSHREPDSKLALNLKITGALALITYGVTQRHSKTTGVLMASGSLINLFSVSLLMGWFQARKEQGYSLSSLQDRMRCVAHNTYLFLNDSQATDMILQIGGTTCVGAFFMPQIEDFCSPLMQTS